MTSRRQDENLVLSRRAGLGGGISHGPLKKGSENTSVKKAAAGPSATAGKEKALTRTWSRGQASASASASVKPLGLGSSASELKGEGKDKSSEDVKDDKRSNTAAATRRVPLGTKAGPRAAQSQQPQSTISIPRPSSAKPRLKPPTGPAGVKPDPKPKPKLPLHTVSATPTTKARPRPAHSHTPISRNPTTTARPKKTLSVYTPAAPSSVRSKEEKEVDEVEYMPPSARERPYEPAAILDRGINTNDDEDLFAPQPQHVCTPLDLDLDLDVQVELELDLGPVQSTNDDFLFDV